MSNIKKHKLFVLQLLAALIFSSFLFMSCDKKELDVQQNFPFEVKVMPLRQGIDSGQTVEIRFAIVRSGNFKDVVYSIRYFQYEGAGLLRRSSNPPYLPNDEYSLPEETFRLYYTSHCTVSQQFDLWITDNFGNEKQLSFQFNNGDE